MALISVAEAARLIGRDRRTLYRDYIATGKLSATTDAKGRKAIDISELQRVFGELGDTAATVAPRQTETVPATNATTEATTELRARIALLEAENAHLRDRLADKDRNLDDLRQAIRLLEDRRPVETRGERPKKRRWWIFG